MSKYVNKKHGMILGSDNIFFMCNDVHAPEGVDHFRDGYRAIVWAKQYSFDEINTVNVFVETPANQIIWKKIDHVEIEKFGDEEFPVTRKRYVLSNYMRYWLDKNVGLIYDKWDVRTLCETNDRVVMFKRRKDALAFVNEVDRMLKGMDYL